MRWRIPSFPRRSRLSDRVVVVTGASSGIGRATALELARRKAVIVLAARRREALREVASQCHEAGGRALVVPTDVTVEEEVRGLAERALGELGRIDAWVNDAAVTCFGTFEEVPSADFRRVIETNLLGTVHGARAALRVFREQGRGVLVNVASGVGRVGQPLASAYVASKWAIVGLSTSLRQELLHEPDIAVCTVLPGSVDTPLFQQGANYTGRRPRPVPPVLDPERVARAIVGAIETPRREAVVGRATRAMLAAERLAPGWVERQVAREVPEEHFLDEPAPPGPGNLYRSLPEHAEVRGGWAGDGGRGRGGAAALAAGAALAGWAVFRWLRS